MSPMRTAALVVISLAAAAPAHADRWRCDADPRREISCVWNEAQCTETAPFNSGEVTIDTRARSFALSLYATSQSGGRLTQGRGGILEGTIRLRAAENALYRLAFDAATGRATVATVAPGRATMYFLGCRRDEQPRNRPAASPARG